MKDPYAVQVGIRMRRARQLRGWSIAEVERRSGGTITAAAAQHWETGSRSVPVERLDAFARLLGLPFEALLPGPGADELLAAFAARRAA